MGCGVSAEAGQHHGAKFAVECAGAECVPSNRDSLSGNSSGGEEQKDSGSPRVHGSTPDVEKQRGHLVLRGLVVSAPRLQSLFVLLPFMALCFSRVRA